MKNYIVFEGCDYTGKTTYAKAFVEYLNNITSLQAVYTKEPGCPYSEACLRIRELIINSKDIKNPETYSYLFAADTFEHIESYVIPMLNENQIVISDRAVVSDFAYRPELKINLRDYNLNKFKSLKPLVIWCRAIPEVIQDRFLKRQDTNEFERIHVMSKIDNINKAYEKFFYENQDLDVIEWFSEDDKGQDQRALFNQIINY